jgi:hypothetical protein
VDIWKKLTNSRNRVRKKSFGGTFCFSNCHIIGVFLVSDYYIEHTEIHCYTCISDNKMTILRKKRTWLGSNHVVVSVLVGKLVTTF